jgi:CDP-diacylglycerol--glycerol-3-phosphate 3-phosphatidyltransferase
MLTDPPTLTRRLRVETGMLRAQIWTPANAITASRIVAGPIVIWLLTAHSTALIWVGLILMIVAELTDLIDGIVARYSAKVSNFGKILDPMADCLYRSSVFIAFVINGWMPVWMFAIIVWRDLTVSYLREIAELQSATLAARSSGKWKAIVQGIAQIGVVGMVGIFGVDSFAPYSMTAQGLLLIATAVTAYSLFDYIAGVAQKFSRRDVTRP